LFFFLPCVFGSFSQWKRYPTDFDPIIILQDLIAYTSPRPQTPPSKPASFLPPQASSQLTFLGRSCIIYSSEPAGTIMTPPYNLNPEYVAESQWLISPGMGLLSFHPNPPYWFFSSLTFPFYLYKMLWSAPKKVSLFRIRRIPSVSACFVFSSTF